MESPAPVSHILNLTLDDTSDELILASIQALLLLGNSPSSIDTIRDVIGAADILPKPPREKLRLSLETYWLKCSKGKRRVLVKYAVDSKNCKYYYIGHPNIPITNVKTKPPKPPRRRPKQASQPSNLSQSASFIADVDGSENITLTRTTSQKNETDSAISLVDSEEGSGAQVATPAFGDDADPGFLIEIQLTDSPSSNRSSQPSQRTDTDESKVLPDTSRVLQPFCVHSQVEFDNDSKTPPLQTPEPHSKNIPLPPVSGEKQQVNSVRTPQKQKEQEVSSGIPSPLGLARDSTLANISAQTKRVKDFKLPKEYFKVKPAALVTPMKPAAQVTPLKPAPSTVNVSNSQKADYEPFFKFMRAANDALSVQQATTENHSIIKTPTMKTNTSSEKRTPTSSLSDSGSTKRRAGKVFPEVGLNLEEIISPRKRLCRINSTPPKPRSHVEVLVPCVPSDGTNLSTPELASKTATDLSSDPFPSQATPERLIDLPDDTPATLTHQPFSTPTKSSDVGTTESILSLNTTPKGEQQPPPASTPTNSDRAVFATPAGASRSPGTPSISITGGTPPRDMWSDNALELIKSLYGTPELEFEDDSNGAGNAPSQKSEDKDKFEACDATPTGPKIWRRDAPDRSPTPVIKRTTTTMQPDLLQPGLMSSPSTIIEIQDDAGPLPQPSILGLAISQVENFADDSDVSVDSLSLDARKPSPAKEPLVKAPVPSRRNHQQQQQKQLQQIGPIPIDSFDWTCSNLESFTEFHDRLAFWAVMQMECPGCHKRYKYLKHRNCVVCWSKGCETPSAGFMTTVEKQLPEVFRRYRATALRCVENLAEPVDEEGFTRTMHLLGEVCCLFWTCWSSPHRLLYDVERAVVVCSHTRCGGHRRHASLMDALRDREPEMYRKVETLHARLDQSRIVAGGADAAVESASLQSQQQSSDAKVEGPSESRKRPRDEPAQPTELPLLEPAVIQQQPVGLDHEIESVHICSEDDEDGPEHFITAKRPRNTATDQISPIMDGSDITIESV